MSKKDEALKLALEALEKAYRHCPVHTESEVFVRLSITTIRKALAEQPAQQHDQTEIAMGKKDEALKPWQDIADAAGILRAHNHMGLADRLLRHAEALAEQPAQQQEPFGYLWPTGMHPEFRYTQQKRDGVDGTPVYTSPPVSKPWVELTDEEIAKTHESQVWDARRSYARAIEAKLREKNA